MEKYNTLGDSMLQRYHWQDKKISTGKYMNWVMRYDDKYRLFVMGDDQKNLYKDTNF